MSRQPEVGVVIALLLLSSVSSILVVNTSATSNPSTTSLNQQAAASYSSVNPATTYGIGLSGAPVVMDVSTLSQLGGKPYSKSTMELNITRYFAPLGIHLVFLDPGWDNDANTSTTLAAGGFSQQVADWLSLGVKYQINTIFFFKQFGYFFSSPSWDVSFLNSHPNAGTVNGSGVNVPFPIVGCSGCIAQSGWTIADSSDLYTQLRTDLEQFYKWYGGYSSWIGIGEGATGDRNAYASSGTTIKGQRPWDNGTIYTFAHSLFFERNINSTGYYIGTNVLSKVWAEFLSEGPETTYSVGYGFATERDQNVYSGSSWTESFTVPIGAIYKGFTLKAFLGKAGSPTSSLTETLLANYSGYHGAYKAIETETVSASSVGSTAGWVDQAFTSTLIPSLTYEVTFSSSTSSSAYYTVASDGLSQYQDSVLWVQSTTGANIAIEPWVNENNANWHAIPNNQVYFEVPNTMTVNTVNWMLSDRAYDPNNITFSLVNTVTNTKLASGSIGVQKWRGFTNYSPSQLSKVVTLQPDIKYEFIFSALPSGDNYDGAGGGGVVQDFIASNINPSYVGQSTVPSFQLSYGNPQLSASNLNYISQTDLQDSPGEHGTDQVAVRFKAPGTGALNTFEVEVTQAPNVPGASLIVTLNHDNLTCRTGISGTCSHPAVGSGGVIATGSILLSSINSSFKSGACYGGHCTWANVTFSGGSMTSGTYYWVVLNSGSNYVGLERLVNPWQFLVYTSANGWKSSWGVPSDGPSEFAFQIQTSAGDIDQTIIGQSQYTFSSGAFAQSFQSSTAFQLIGVAPDITNGGSNFNITGYVETDSGSDSPSGEVLAFSTNIPQQTDLLLNVGSSGFGKAFGWGLNHPVNMTANTKYWLVYTVKCAALSCSSPARAIFTLYRSDASSKIQYGGSTLHYEIQSGSTWQNQPYGLGDMPFILYGSNVTMKSYDTKTLYSEIKGYDAQSGGSSSGWNSFLDYYETSLMYNLTVYMTGLSGKQFYWYEGITTVFGNMVPNYGYVLEGNSGSGGPIGCDVRNPTCGGQQGFFAGELNAYLSGKTGYGNQSNWLLWASLGSGGDNGGTLSLSDYRDEYLTTYPPSAQSILAFDDWVDSVHAGGILNMTQNTYTRSFGQLLSRMTYNGGWFGTSKGALKVLWVTTPSNDGDFPAFLESAVQVTTTTDTNLTNYDLSNYNVIVNSGGLTSGALSRVESFVNSGGGYVQTAFGDSSGETSAMLGLQSSTTSVSTTSTLTVTKHNKITSPYTSVSYDPYWVRYAISNLSGSSATVLLRDSNRNPVITTNNYGRGIGVLVEQGLSRLSSYTPGDSYVTLLIDAAFYAAHKSNMLPIIWDGSYGTNSALKYFSVDGSPGNPLFWASDNSSSKQSFDIHLNATFYGVAAPWVAVDMQNMSVVASGTTDDIHLKVVMQPWTWMPIYILSIPQNLGPVYSTASITSISSSGPSVGYTTQGPANASSWLVLSSTSPVSVTSSMTDGSLPSYPSLSALNLTKIGTYCTSIALGGRCNSFSSFRQQGWYYDQSNSLLYVHFQQGSPVTITIFGGLPISTTSTTSTSTSTTQTTTSTSTSTTQTTTSTSTSTTQKTTTTSHQTTTRTSTTSSTAPQFSTSTASTTQTTTTTSYSTTAPTSTTSTSTTTGATPRFDFSVSPSANYGEVSQGGRFNFSIAVIDTSGTAEPVMLQVGGVPSGVSVYFTKDSSSSSFTTAATIAVSSSVHPGSYAISLSGLSSSAQHSFTFLLVVKPRSYTVVIQTTPSAGGSITPSAGSHVVPAGSDFIVSEMPTDGRVFREWLVDGAAAGNASSIIVHVTNDTTVLALFEPAPQPEQGPPTLYSVAISEKGAPSPQIWIDGTTYQLPARFSWPQGSIHVISTSREIPITNDSRATFLAWTGSLNSSKSSASLMVNGTVTLRADYLTRYAVQLCFEDQSGNLIHPDNLTLADARGGVVAVPSSGQDWLLNGTYLLNSARWKGSQLVVAGYYPQVKVEGPSAATLRLPVYNVVVRVQDIFGNPLSGATLTMHFADDTAITATTGADGVAHFSQVPRGTLGLDAQYLGVPSQFTIDAAQGQSPSITVALSYPVYGLIGAAVGTIAVAIFALKRRTIYAT